MDERELFSNSIYEEQAQLAERELSSFIAAVTKLYGPEQAGLSAEDWLDESDLMDSPPRSEARDWRAVTIAASARLANRIDAGQGRLKSVTTSRDTNVSRMLSSSIPTRIFVTSWSPRILGWTIFRAADKRSNKMLYPSRPIPNCEVIAGALRVSVLVLFHPCLCTSQSHQGAWFNASGTGGRCSPSSSRPYGTYFRSLAGPWDRP
jgi:hypothetical protein